MAKEIIRFGIIGTGLMGREFASAAARWQYLLRQDVAPQITAVAGHTPAGLEWFAEGVPGLRVLTTDYRELLARPEVDAVYCAVPHHLHAQIYADIIRAGKHLFGEKPFGMDLAANQQILAALAEHPRVFARCSSQMPFYPGAQEVIRALREERFGRILEVEAGFWHSSDLDPNKPINWKRQVQYNGAYGCMGDLGMHTLHIPLRFGWLPADVSAILSKIIPDRPGPDGRRVPCDTWDNAQLACRVPLPGYEFPLLVSTKRIAPGEGNTWFLRILGTQFSAEFSTKYPKTLRTMTYRPGQPQGWEARDLGYASAYPTIAGGIFEFGFADAILQMAAAFCDELVHGSQMHGPFACATPAETASQHRIFTAALRSQSAHQVVALDSPSRMAG